MCLTRRFQMDNELEYLLDSVGLSWRETEISQLIFQHKWHDAAQKLEERLEAAPFDPGLLISAAFVYEKKQQVQRASELYDDALLFVRREHQHRLMKEKEDLLKKTVRRPKIIFFVKPDLDRFLNSVVEHLSGTYRTKKIVVHDLNQIDTGMQWADICWFEWCDDLLIHGSKVPSAAVKTLICRLHSYEAFTFYIKKVYWQAVDQVIFDGEHMREYVLDQVKTLKKEKTAVVPNGIKLDQYTFQQRQKGFHIAYVGYINYKKGPMLLLQAFKALIDKDPRYKLFIAGTFQDARYQLYFRQMIDELRLTDSVQFDGWQDDMNQYLEDKHYLICTSLLESQHMSAMEAMAKGIKPLIHNFYGAKTIYDESVVWNTIDEFVAMMTSGDYTSLHYRSFIEEHYSYDLSMRKIEEMISGFAKQSELTVMPNPPLITVGIINYNYSNFIDECLQSVLNQLYPNIDILIVDDHSTDDSMQKISSYQKTHPHIRTICHSENTKLPDLAFKEIFQEAKGEYVLLLSADDFLPHNLVIHDFMLCFFEEEGLDYVYGDLLLVDQHGKNAGLWTYQEYGDEELVRTIFQRGGSGIVPMVGMFKTSYYQQKGFTWLVDPQKPLAGDVLNCLANTKRGWKRRYLKKPVLCYRRHQHNISYQLHKRIQSLVYVMDYIVKEFDESVYFPHIKWKELEENQRQSLKYFSIGKTFWRMARRYAQNGYTRHLDQDAKKECIQPLLNKMDEYFQLSLASDNQYERYMKNTKKIQLI